MHGGALLGVAYRMSRRVSPLTATAISTVQSMPLSGYGNSGISSFAALDDGLSQKFAEAAPPNFQLYRLDLEMAFRLLMCYFLTVSACCYYFSYIVVLYISGTS